MIGVYIPMVLLKRTILILLKFKAISEVNKQQAINISIIVVDGKIVLLGDAIALLPRRVKRKL